MCCREAFSMIHKVFKFIIAFVFFLTASAPHAGAEDDLTGEYLVKAAFLYNFAKFVEWPAEAFPDDSAPITLCILGQDPFGGALETIRGKSVKGRKLVIRQSMRVEDLEMCHMLFISSSEKDRLNRILDLVESPNVLTVGDMESFARHGGVVNLIKTGNKIKFEINVDAAREAGLKISSKLLKLAKIVSSNQGQEMN